MSLLCRSIYHLEYCIKHTCQAEWEMKYLCVCSLSQLTRMKISQELKLKCEVHRVCHFKNVLLSKKNVHSKQCPNEEDIA